jgi:DNA polymerase-3 subunit beta
MKITLGSEDFLRILARTQGVVEKRHSMAILTNLLIEAGNDQISITATDLEVSLKQSCPAKVAEGGAATVSARKIFEIVRETNSDEIAVHTTKNLGISVSYGRSKFKLMGIDPADHPGMPANESKPVAKFEIETSQLAEMISKTIFAVSTDDARSNLAGVHVDQADEKGHLRFVSTDGHRLAMIDRKVKGTLPTSGVILPRKGLVELSKLLSEETGSVAITIYEREAVAEAGGCLLSMRLVEGAFPDYNQVVPKETPNVVQIDRDALLHSVRRASLLSSDRAHGVRFRFSQDKLEITASNPDLGEAEEEMEVSYHGKELDIGFNARYLLDVLAILPENSQLEMGLGDQLSPGVIRIDDANYQYVVMPMRI